MQTRQDSTNSTLFVLLIADDLRHYLRSLNLVKPKRLYLTSSKAKSKVSFGDFANGSLALVKPPAKVELNVQVDDRKKSGSHILVDHTELSQIVANGKLAFRRVDL